MGTSVRLECSSDCLLGAAGQLADLLDKADTGLLLDLGTILGMNKFKELQQRLQAVPVARPDTRPRMWISPANPAERLVFDCQRGAIDPLKEPLGEPLLVCIKYSKSGAGQKTEICVTSSKVGTQQETEICSKILKPESIRRQKPARSFAECRVSS